jgi:nucleotide-binding universal stress UspA family protein
MLDMRPLATSKLRQTATDEWAEGRTIIREMREGRPFVEIIRYADEADIDLIVMGTHGWGPISHMLVGSVAEKVVRKAHCPVLTIRPAGHEFIMP